MELTMSRRQLLRLAAATGAVSLVPACGGGDAGAVTWQAIPSYSLQGTDPDRVEYLQRTLAAFQAGAPLPIEPQVSTADTAAAMAKLLLQASQGRAPDVAQVDGYVFDRMAEYAHPLDRQLADAGLVVDDWFPSLQPVMTSEDGSVRSLPFTTDVRVLYHRLDVVPTPPATWDELIRMAKPLTEQDLYVLFPAGRSEGSVATTVWPQYWAQGLDLFAESGDLTFDAGAGYRAMQDTLGVVQRCVAEGVTPTRVATFGSEDNMNADIVAGRVSMFLGGSWQASSLNNALPEKNFFETWGVAPLPSISGERHVTTAGGWVWAAFAEQPRQVDVGIDWVVEAYVGDEGMAAWCTAGGYLPPRQSVYDNPAYEQNPFTPIFRDHLAEYARTRPGNRKYLDVSNSMQIALSSVASGTAGAEEALEQALYRIV
ncbi:substrate-binding domain-containing protein [Pseudonocardia nigra]|uniref:substrate-binding domain-containing protein n=1 Tax=Pseudonocardia nigra TaxID=1921578 RepID=UPI001C5ED943|nr:substrate-binding domain-containing protein [Pseudonocardia nigra]